MDGRGHGRKFCVRVHEIDTRTQQRTDPFTQPVTQFEFSILIGRQCVALNIVFDGCLKKKKINVIASHLSDLL